MMISSMKKLSCNSGIQCIKKNIVFQESWRQQTEVAHPSRRRMTEAPSMCSGHSIRRPEMQQECSRQWLHVAQEQKGWQGVEVHHPNQTHRASVSERDGSVGRESVQGDDCSVADETDKHRQLWTAAR